MWGENMQNPFSTTFSKMPEYTYISTIEPKEIVENFSYDSPTEAVYKITGIRGSGKTVILANVQNEMKSKRNQENGWLVYTLNPARDMLSQFAANLYNEGFIKEGIKSKSISLSAQFLGTGGGIGFSKENNNMHFDIGVEIRKMLDEAQNQGKKILICVDEVSKTQEMIVFSLEFGGWLVSNYPVYFVCTGLYENVLALGNTKNLTFFRRGTSIETKPLNRIKMSEMYKEKLSVDSELAQKMADITKGYAYAFQELGTLFFKNGKKSDLEAVIAELKAELFSYSYEKIWEEMSAEDKFLASLLTEKEEYKRNEVLEMMGERSKNYSIYRDRLKKRGVISVRQGYIGLNPPFFGEYIREYGGI